MNGLGMMLKALGVDVNPEEIILTVQNMAKHIAEMHASQMRTEAMVSSLYNGTVVEDRNNGQHTGSSGGNGSIQIGSSI